MRAASVFRLETLRVGSAGGYPLGADPPRGCARARDVSCDARRVSELGAQRPRGGRGRRHRCRVVVGCSRSSELVELDGTALEATGRRAGAWVTAPPKRPADAWLTGVALDRASGDIFAAQYQKRGVLRFDANLRYRKILHGVGKRLECPEGVAVARGRVFVATGQGILAVLDQATGEILDRRLAETPDDAHGGTCVPWGLTVGPDDALYVCVDDSYHGEPPDFYPPTAMPQMRRDPPHGSRPPSPPRRRRLRRVDRASPRRNPRERTFRDSCDPAVCVFTRDTETSSSPRSTRGFGVSRGRARRSRASGRESSSPRFRPGLGRVQTARKRRRRRTRRTPSTRNVRTRANRDGANEDAAVRRVRAAASGWDGVRERARGEQVRARGRGGVRRRGARPRMDSTRTTSRGRTRT